MVIVVATNFIVSMLSVRKASSFVVAIDVKWLKFQVQTEMSFSCRNELEKMEAKNLLLQQLHFFLFLFSNMIHLRQCNRKNSCIPEFVTK